MQLPFLNITAAEAAEFSPIRFVLPMSSLAHRARRSRHNHPDDQGEMRYAALMKAGVPT